MIRIDGYVTEIRKDMVYIEGVRIPVNEQYHTVQFWCTTHGIQEEPGGVCSYCNSDKFEKIPDVELILSIQQIPDDIRPKLREGTYVTVDFDLEYGMTFKLTDVGEWTEEELREAEERAFEIHSKIQWE